METSSRLPASGPISLVSSLLLQDKDEIPVKEEPESLSTEAAQPGASSGLFIDWLELLDPEVISSCPDLQQRLLFSWNKAFLPSARHAPAARASERLRDALTPPAGLLPFPPQDKGPRTPEPPSFRPYLLAVLTHQFDPTASLDFLWACIHIPRIWQGRDQRIPQKRREEFVLRLTAPELISLVELILAESETRSQNCKEASCSLIQSRLPLLLSCCYGNIESIKKVAEHLASCIQQLGGSSMGKHCQGLLLQIYLQLPELLVPVPELLQSSEGAAESSTCKLDGLIHRFITLLADSGDSKMSENRLWDANMACRKLAVAHPILLLRHLPMVAALLHGRVHLNFQEFRQQNHLTFFIHVLGILELLQPQVFQSEHQGALWDCLLSFIRLLLSYRKSSRHLATFITKFVQFIHKYITINAPAAVSFLQKHSDPLHDLSSDNSDLAMLKSLLAGLSSPSKNGTSDRGADNERDDEAVAGSLPLVSVSLFTPLTPAEMSPYMKRLSRGQTVE
ncbi:Integrator complex subunit 1, partial [Varanus komodoensis]